jgi:hypothetical protein
MRKSPGRVARPLCLLVALGFCAATVFALIIGGTRHGEQAAVGLQMAVTLAMLGVLWALIGIMFTVARHGEPARPYRRPPDDEAVDIDDEAERVNWFRDHNPAGSARRR